MRAPSPNGPRPSDPEGFREDAPASEGLTLGQEWRVWGIAVAVSAAVLAAIHGWLGRADGIPAAWAALGFCAAAAALPIRWRRGSIGTRAPIVSTLLTITFRTLLMVGCLGFVAATKWPHRKSFALSLLGCYFIFLVLESVLSIRWYSSRTRAEHP